MPVPRQAARYVQGSCDLRPQLTTGWNEQLMVRSEKAEVDRQLPLGEEIFLDHVGHFVPDRDAARGRA